MSPAARRLTTQKPSQMAKTPLKSITLYEQKPPQSGKTPIHASSKTPLQQRPPSQSKLSGMNTFDNRSALKPKPFNLRDSSLKGKEDSGQKLQRPHSSSFVSSNSKTPKIGGYRKNQDITNLLSPQSKGNPPIRQINSQQKALSNSRQSFIGKGSSHASNNSRDRPLLGTTQASQNIAQ